MAKRTTHKHRAFEKLTALGWTVGDVERRIPHSNITKDLFGVADLMAVRGKKTLALQVTSNNGGHVSKHVNKLLDEPRLWDCLTAGWIVEIWGIRNKPTRDGSFAVTRLFELHKDGSVSVHDASSILT